MENHKVGVYFFSNDLRLHDNPGLALAAKEVDQLLCVFHYPIWWSKHNKQQLKSLGKHRDRFLAETLADLQSCLQSLGQTLIVTDHSYHDFLSQILQTLPVTHVYHSENAGYFEQGEWLAIKQTFELQFTQVVSHTLFEKSHLPFALTNLPDTFSKFRKLIEDNISPALPIETINKLPPPPISADLTSKNDRSLKHTSLPCELVGFKGGETAANIQLEYYFSGSLPAHYKEVRNSIDGWNNSSKFSPWLANGSLSPRSLIHRLKKYEEDIQENNSTYWLYFELLWREYFQWYAHRYANKLFCFEGIKGKKPLTSYYSERFRKWCVGNTPYPIVNASMRELNETGYISNRARQIVASCLVNELQVDWRYGAAYFEQQLIDYDVASNWGNWQYLAGVGADSRDKRHFNLDKQTQLFDPDGVYREKWRAGAIATALDSVDAADWPII